MDTMTFANRVQRAGKGVGMELQLLTLRGIYTLLKKPGEGSKPYLTRRLKFTLYTFWEDFLISSVPGTLLDSYFDKANRKTRILSKIMNREPNYSLSADLYNAL